MPLNGFSRRARPLLFSLVWVSLSLTSFSCSNLSINSLMTYDVRNTFSVPLATLTTTGQDTQWSFTVNIGPEVDSISTSPSQIYSAEVSRVLLVSDATYPLTNLSNASLYVSSRTVKDTLVGQTSVFKSASQVDLTPNMTEIAGALHDSVLTFTLHLTAKTIPSGADSLQCNPTIAVISR